MTIINDRYYANPQYGKALERARAADVGSMRDHGEEDPSWLDHFLGFTSTAAEKQREAQSERALAQANGANRNERAAMSYSEKTDGTVAEHEAMQSTVMNRVASGERQYVDKRMEVNQYNVITQYQGVTKDKFQAFDHEDAQLPGARNAAKADENLKRTGKPTNDATFFIVNHGGKLRRTSRCMLSGTSRPSAVWVMFISINRNRLLQDTDHPVRSKERN